MKSHCEHVFSVILLFFIYLYNNNNNTTTTNKKSKHKTLPEPGIEPGASRTPVWSATTRPQIILSVTIEVQLLSTSKHKQTKQNLQATFSTKSFFSNIKICMDNYSYICQFLMFTGVGFTE